MQMARANLFGVGVDAQRFDDAISTLISWVRERRRAYVCTCPVYTLMMCRERPDVGQAVAGADMVTADGMPIVWVQRRMGYTAERVYGPDVMLALCEATAGTDITHYFWGGLPGVPEKLADVLTARYPGLKIAGVFSPPVAPVPDTPDPETVARLNASKADIVWIGLGSPKQDLWMARYRPALDAPLLIGVGAAFDLLSGEKRQAPRWMQRSGLEWVFRLAQEPGRLARRYLVYNPQFVLLVIRHGLLFRRG
jgi:N-acetylglucosaminyldiphosphoundecaprenol N-acetyl-beta-D-mannosaminyltransferase